MIKEVRDELRIRFKVLVLDFAKIYGNTSKASREFEVPRSTFYAWKKAFNAEGRAGLVRKKPIA
jgi:transposase-like protein